ncbi:MAG: LysE family translocator [Pseudanabaenales cyanobacterium]|nr:LysE family translocator [Pseudanabaenales cyanobacterium]
MNELAPYFGFATVSLMMAVSPGPSWVYTVSTTLGQGRRSGMIGNLGNSTGILFHAVAATAWLSALLSYSATAFHLLKFIGAAYLIYLGICAFRGRGVLSASPNRSFRCLWQIYRDGALVNILNPKMSILFIALLPQFVARSAPNPEIQIAIMGVMHAVIAGIVHTHVVFFSSAISSRLKPSGRIQSTMRWATGTLFIGFGVQLAI